MKSGKVIQAIAVSAVLVALLAGVGCGSTESQDQGGSLEPRIEALAYVSGHILWDYDASTGEYEIVDGFPITVAGSSFPPQTTVGFHLDLVYPEDIFLGNVTTNAVGAFYAVLPMRGQEVAPDSKLDTSWTCQPPLCPQPIVREWRACQLKATIGDKVVAACPMVAHRPWGETGNTTSTP